MLDKRAVNDHQLIVDGWEKLMGDADSIIIWNPEALERACMTAVHCMAPVREDRLSSKDLFDKLTETIHLNSYSGM